MRTARDQRQLPQVREATDTREELDQGRTPSALITVQRELCQAVQRGQGLEETLFEIESFDRQRSQVLCLEKNAVREKESPAGVFDLQTL